MMDAISSLTNYVMTRDEVAMSLAKRRIDAEAAMARMIMEMAENIEQLSSGDIGSNIDIYA